MNLLAMHELRYAIMRLMRSLIGIVALVAALAAAAVTTILGIITAFMGVFALYRLMGARVFGDGPLWAWFTPVYFLMGVGIVAACIGCWFSVASPYRYQTIPPGIPSMACPKCGAETPIFGRCVECRGPLPQQTHSVVGMVLSGIVTVINLLVDIMGVFIGLI